MKNFIMPISAFIESDCQSSDNLGQRAKKFLSTSSLIRPSYTIRPTIRGGIKSLTIFIKKVMTLLQHNPCKRMTKWLLTMLWIWDSGFQFGRQCVHGASCSLHCKLMRIELSNRECTFLRRGGRGLALVLCQSSRVRAHRHYRGEGSGQIASKFLLRNLWMDP